MIYNDKGIIHFVTSSPVLILLAITILMISGCNMPEEGTSPTLSLGDQQTKAAQTVIAELTVNVPTQAPPSQTPIATTPQQPTATSTHTETPEPTETVTIEAIATVPPLPDYKKILDEDFSSGRGWYEEEGENFGFMYVDEGYLIYVNLRQATIWSIRDVERDDIRLEISAEQVAGPMDGYYGVTCRHQDQDNYYALVISNNGTFGIGRMLGGEFEFMQEGNAPEGIINANGDNQMTADCIDNSLILYANNIKLLEVQDENFQSGVYGLVAGTRLNDGIEVVFKQLTVFSP